MCSGNGFLRPPFGGGPALQGGEEVLLPNDLDGAALGPLGLDLLQLPRSIISEASYDQVAGLAADGLGAPSPLFLDFCLDGLPVAAAVGKLSREDKGAAGDGHRSYPVKGDLFQGFFLFLDADALLVHNGVTLFLVPHRLLQNGAVDRLLGDAANPLRQLSGELVRLEVGVPWGVVLILLIDAVSRALKAGTGDIPLSVLFIGKGAVAGPQPKDVVEVVDPPRQTIVPGLVHQTVQNFLCARQIVVRALLQRLTQPAQTGGYIAGKPAHFGGKLRRQGVF